MANSTHIDTDPDTGPRVDAIAYLDEAGAKGYVRNLAPEKDDEIALLCSIVVPTGVLEEVRAAIAPFFDDFKKAMPVGGKVHITDAFKPGNERWATVARSAREGIFVELIEHQIPIVYDARRTSVARRSASAFERMRARARAKRRSNIKVSERPNDERLEAQCIAGLALKLDAFAQDCTKAGLHMQSIELATDTMDSAIAELLRTEIEDTRNLSKETEYVGKGWDPALKEPVEGRFTIEILSAMELDVKNIGDLVVIGKEEPLIFAIDVVTNALHDHLSALSSDAPLNAPSSIAGWRLGQRVYGVRENAFEDLL